MNVVGPYLVWIALGLTALSGVVSTLLIALTIVPRASVEELAGKRGRPALVRRASLVMTDWMAHARALWLIRIIIDLGAAGCAVYYVAHVRAAPGTFEITPTWIDALIGLTSTGIVLWMTTGVIPLAVAQHAGPRVLVSRATFIRAVQILTSPVAVVGRFADEVVRRLVGVERRDHEEQVEQEIMTVVEEAEASGALDGQEAEMLASVMRFRDLNVAQIMTPRTDMEAIELTSDLGAVIRAVREVKHSRIPVYEESLDSVVGIFYVKDLMMWLGGEGKIKGGAFNLKDLLRPAIFVPETKTIRDLLKELMEKKVHIALVADEYGGTAGLVTIEDIVEEIFGDIKDEYEAPTAEAPDAIVQLDARTAELDAAARITDVNELIEPLGVQLPTSEDYDTVGGFVMTTLGRIPAAGEQFGHERMYLTILEAKPTKVVKVKLEVRDEASAEAESESSAGRRS